MCAAISSNRTITTQCVITTNGPGDTIGKGGVYCVKISTVTDNNIPTAVQTEENRIAILTMTG